MKAKVSTRLVCECCNAVPPLPPPEIVSATISEDWREVYVVLRFPNPDHGGAALIMSLRLEAESPLPN